MLDDNFIFIVWTTPVPQNRLTTPSSKIGVQESLNKRPCDLAKHASLVGPIGLLPAAAQRLIKLNHTKQFLQADLGQVQLALEQVAVGVERVQLRVHAAAISKVGEAEPVLERLHQRHLLF